MNNILKLNDIKQTLKKEKNEQMYLKYKQKQVVCETNIFYKISLVKFCLNFKWE